MPFIAAVRGMEQIAAGLVSATLLPFLIAP